MSTCENITPATLEDSMVSENTVTREVVGICYAGGAGLLIGTSIVYATDPALGWVIGSIAMALGFALEEVRNQISDENTGQEGNDGQ